MVLIFSLPNNLFRNLFTTVRVRRRAVVTGLVLPPRIRSKRGRLLVLQRVRRGGLLPQCVHLRMFNSLSGVVGMINLLSFRPLPLALSAVSCDAV